LICSWITENAYVAVLLRDLIFNDILPEMDMECVNFDLLGDIVLQTQIRLPFLPIFEDDIAFIPQSVRDACTSWASILERIHRLPSIETRIKHPTWAVRRHF
tara:strand:+ start:266 stop:571 length:306 start_codon:yes stop_codon:yes gene_type:complete